MPKPNRSTAAFWEALPLSALNKEQWEALCDRCGRCCLEKMTNGRNGKVYYTSVACPLLDPASCQCRNYSHRHGQVPNCVRLTPRNLADCRWLPRTCAYRLLLEGRSLPDWHPLVSGCPDSVHTAGISIRGRRLHSMTTDHEPLEAYIVDWGIWSKKARHD